MTYEPNAVSPGLLWSCHEKLASYPSQIGLRSAKLDRHVLSDIKRITDNNVNYLAGIMRNLPNEKSDGRRSLEYADKKSILTLRSIMIKIS